MFTNLLPCQNPILSTFLVTQVVPICFLLGLHFLLPDLVGVVFYFCQLSSMAIPPLPKCTILQMCNCAILQSIATVQLCNSAIVPLCNYARSFLDLVSVVTHPWFSPTSHPLTRSHVFSAHFSILNFHHPSDIWQRQDQIASSPKWELFSHKFLPSQNELWDLKNTDSPQCASAQQDRDTSYWLFSLLSRMLQCNIRVAHNEWVLRTW